MKKLTEKIYKRFPALKFWFFIGKWFFGSALIFWVLMLVIAFWPKSTKAQSWDCEKYPNAFSFSFEKVDSNAWTLNYTFSYTEKVTIDTIYVEEEFIRYKEEIPDSTIMFALKKCYFSDKVYLIKDSLVFSIIDWPNKLQMQYALFAYYENKTLMFEDFATSNMKEISNLSKWLILFASLFMLLLLSRYHYFREKRKYQKKQGSINAFNAYFIIGFWDFVIALICIAGIFGYLIVIRQTPSIWINLVVWSSSFIIFYGVRFAIFKIVFRKIPRQEKENSIF